MSEHADTIRETLHVGWGITAGEALAALAALDALEADLAVARRERDEILERFRHCGERRLAAEAENARLKAVLEPFACPGIGLPMAWLPMQWWPFVEDARAVLASGSEGDTAACHNEPETGLI